MAASHSAQKAGERVEELLAELGAQAGPQAAATAEELVASLVEFYGAGLAEIVQIISQDVEAGKRLMTKLAADPLVESLLLLHDLHPLPDSGPGPQGDQCGHAPARRARRAGGVRRPGRGRRRPHPPGAQRRMAARPTPERCRRPSSRRWPTPRRTRRASVSRWSTAAPELPLLQIGRSPAARGAQ